MVTQAKTSINTILAPLNDELQSVESVLKERARVRFAPLAALLEMLLSSGGKRVRPAILLLAGHMGNFEPERLILQAAAIEMLHTATLVHDDTIDRSTTRRGRPTLNSQLPEAETVLIGDYLFAQSAMMSAQSGSVRVLDIFARTLGTICDGELAQLSSVHQISSREEYYSRVYGKTGVLFASSAEIGAFMAGLDEDAIQALRFFGRQIGIAFQIIDDILDMVGTVDQIGKPVGGDIRQGTVTLPLILYFEQSRNETDRELIQQALSKSELSDEKVHQVIDLVVASGAIEQAHDIASNFIAEAQTALSSFPESIFKTALGELASYITNREK